MCIAVPMKIIEFMPDNKALAEAAGNRFEIDIRLIGEIKAEDFVLVHAGCAIERVDNKAAADILTVMEEISGYERSLQ